MWSSPNARFWSECGQKSMLRVRQSIAIPSETRGCPFQRPNFQSGPSPLGSKIGTPKALNVAPKKGAGGAELPADGFALLRRSLLAHGWEAIVVSVCLWLCGAVVRGFCKQRLLSGM